MYVLPGFAEPVRLGEIVTAGSLLIGGAIIGWLIQRVVVRRLKRTATVTVWGGDEVIAAALRGIVVVWSTLAGAFGALSVLPLNRRVDDALDTILLAAVVLSITLVVARLVADLIKLYSLRSAQTLRSSSILVNLARIVIGAIGLLILLQTLGVSITALLTAVGVGGLAVALAMQDTLSNFFAGLQILATKKVKRGDFVRLQSGEEGYIADIDWRHTSLRQLSNNMVLVPNAQLANSLVTNYYYPAMETSVLMEVGIGYASDLEHVERVTVDVGRQVQRNVEGAVPDFEPFIRYHTFNDSSIDLTVILRVREFTAQYLLKHEFMKRLHERYAAEGIVIPFPMRTLEWPEARTAMLSLARAERGGGSLPSKGRLSDEIREESLR